MSKINKKGFAFSELLMVTVVVIGIFMIIYSNIFSIMGELENRNKYNDLSANYVAFYVRKALLNDYFDELEINSGNYKILYPLTPSVFSDEFDDYLEEAGVEKIILTNDYIGNLKSISVDGFDDYIDYLPNYNNLKDDGIEQYRIILKTNNGYATTEVKFDVNDYKDVVFKFDDGGKTLSEYIGTNDVVRVPDFVNKIGNNAFEDNSNVKSVYLPKSIKNLEAYAFLNDNISDVFLYSDNLEDVDEEAFSISSGQNLTINVYDCNEEEVEEVADKLKITNFESVKCMLEFDVGGGDADE